MKKRTKKKKIRQITEAPFLYIPLLQHIGKLAEPLVKVGDKVKKYQQIGRPADGLSAPVHASVSGWVRAVGNHPLADGTQVPSICIENDFKETEEERVSRQWEELSSGEILGLIRDAGIVGEGGAQFPTFFKYVSEGKPVHTLIVNGTECEPYLTADYALMEQHTRELVEGIRIIDHLLHVKQIVITLEEQNKELRSVFEPLVSH